MAFVVSIDIRLAYLPSIRYLGENKEQKDILVILIIKISKAHPHELTDSFPKECFLSDTNSRKAQSRDFF